MNLKQSQSNWEHFILLLILYIVCFSSVLLTPGFTSDIKITVQSIEGCSMKKEKLHKANKNY